MFCCTVQSCLAILKMKREELESKLMGTENKMELWSELETKTRSMVEVVPMYVVSGLASHLS